MVVKGRLLKSMYRDSIALMRIASALFQRDEIARAEVLVATPVNLESLRHDGLHCREIDGATPNDIVMVVEATTEAVALDGLEWAETALKSPTVATVGEAELTFSLDSAIKRVPAANLALLSIPGPFVRREAMKALEHGLHLLIFSDNVPIEDEIAIKKFADQDGLLVMGPDCGTAFISGAALAFANKVRRGNIGIIAAAGTGMQEVACLIDRAGLGISHGIGTGSNDVKAVVGAITLRRGLRMLEADEGTKVIVIVTKPPEDSVAQAVLGEVKQCTKPVVVNFLGGDTRAVSSAGAIPAVTLEDAARLAVEANGGIFLLGGEQSHKLAAERQKLSPSQKYIRGVFSGGTFTAEAALILRSDIDDVYTNTRLNGTKPLSDAKRSVGHTCVDMGEDEFTRGKPHPMLEPMMRHQRILQEADDPETAVILLDVVLGFGVHPDPAGVLVDTLRKAREKAAADGRYLPVVASVCGTDGDPQVRSKQVAKLRNIGVLVFASNAEAVRASAAIALD